jgi:mannose-6-phosphate isomerase class I
MTATPAPRPYEANPRYAPITRPVVRGWRAAVADLPTGPVVLALDGPSASPWEMVVAGLTEALRASGRSVTWLDLREFFAPWEQIVKQTSSPELANDPHFERLATTPLHTFFTDLPAVRRPEDGILLVYGPGAALVRHDVLWYADLPKRYAEAAVNAGTAGNLGQPAWAGAGTAKRLFYIDWPVLDAHRDAVAPRIDRWVDMQRPDGPTSVDGPTLRRTMADLARQPFRTRPTFNTTSWGGHWAQRNLGFNPRARNTALGYELIAPESGVLIGTADAEVEVPFQLLVATHPQPVLGEQVHTTFGTSFPIRFDYLDTVDGGNLSVHVHPQPEYMSKVFGWPYTQHETYYLMVGGEDRKVFLGLRDGVDVDAFYEHARAAHHHEKPFDIEQHVQTFPAEPHRLFVIPAGTPHGSGEGNVVLEVSATPYLYSLRFYDWLRRDDVGAQRPVHLQHAFDNLNTARTGRAVADHLVQEPRILRRGSGWYEEMLGCLPEMFFEVRRIVIGSDVPAPDDTGDRFHVLNVVDGEGVLVETEAGHHHTLAYAETLVVPAAVGRYTIRRAGRRQTRLVKALVR